MSLIFLESFDLIDTAHFNDKGWIPNGGIIEAGGRTGNRMSISGISAVRNCAAGAHAKFTLGAAFQVNAVGADYSGGNRLMTLLGDNGATQHIYVSTAADGAITVVRGDGVILGSGGVIEVDTWNYLEISVTLSDTVGAVTVNLNDGTIINLSGIDTKNGGTAAVFDTIHLGNGSGGGEPIVKFDDVYCTNGAGTINTGMLGDLTVNAILPSGNGASSQFTNDAGNQINNYSHVDSVPPGASYVQSTAVGQVDSYAFTDLPEAAGTVLGVQAVALASKTGTGSSSLAPVARVGGTTYEGTPQPLSTSPEYIDQMWEQSPAGGAWTLAAVNAAEFGIQSA